MECDSKMCVGNNVGIGTTTPSSDWKVDVNGALVASSEIRSESLLRAPVLKAGPFQESSKYPEILLYTDQSTTNNGADISIIAQGNGGSSYLTNYISNWGGAFYWQFGSKDGNVTVMSLTGGSGNLSVKGTIKSSEKKQIYAHIPISTLDDYHEKCDICSVGTNNGSCALTMMYCTAACHRYCNQVKNYSGGTLVEHDSVNSWADCLCVP